MSNSVQRFDELNLIDPLIKAVTELGFETPLPIQAECIPPILNGDDVMGLAQTGTGKTAAFVLPLLSKIDLSNNSPQVLVLCPTRELALQVAESFQACARYMRGFHVLPIYGGQRYSFQFNQLRRGPHVIVGTPGRIRDHLKRRTLDLSGVQTMVLDEADEMLRMGFLEEVEEIMAETPDERQVALFSATMPHQIKRITKKFMKKPVEIKIEAKTSTAENIEQVYMVVPNRAKFEALARLLETESYDAILIFVRTRVATTELAERLSARGFDVAALNGEMTQVARERTVDKLKNGKIDIVVATDVAARGLHVDRISLVINFDIPGDSEAYIHRVGRTGRVGKYGKAILFASPREKRILQSIERVTRQPLYQMEMPSHDAVTLKRVEKFRDSLVETMSTQGMGFFQDLTLELLEDMNIDILQLAAGAICMAQKDRPLLVEKTKGIETTQFDSPNRKGGRRVKNLGSHKMSRSFSVYKVKVGSDDGVEVRNILGAIANETGMNRDQVGQIRIHPKYSTVELPQDLPKDIYDHLQTTMVARKPLKLKLAEGEEASGSRRNQRPYRKPRSPREDRPFTEKRPTRVAKKAEPVKAEKPAKSKPPVKSKPKKDKPKPVAAKKKRSGKPRKKKN
ncbi:DEAD/DEAH box helicase [bacterium]|jgi:ATP-dependent RNA helicase DeaD|nr:DEAD/DEAH box helicase [bacterium]MBT4291771.1 DEAD/DEAH box helicase [bacterium]